MDVQMKPWAPGASLVGGESNEQMDFVVSDFAGHARDSGSGCLKTCLCECGLDAEERLLRRQRRCDPKGWSKPDGHIESLLSGRGVWPTSDASENGCLHHS